MIAVHAALKPLYVENEIFVLNRTIANIIYLDFIACFIWHTIL